MLLAFDTYYYGNKAKTVGLVFEQWNNEKPRSIYSEVIEDIAEYIPGEFYKRELPCILSLLHQIKEPIETIIIDGYVYLDDDNKLGLGGHLYESLYRKMPIIGVAKTNFATLNQNKIKLLRGQSIKPLYITAAGITKEKASRHIQAMHGNYRIPSLLKEVDAQTRIEVK